MVSSCYKEVKIDGTHLKFYGVSDSDPYFELIVDDFESGFARICRRFIKQNYNVLDIGANIGVTASLMARHVQDGIVHAFEPGRKVYETLLKNIEENQIVNVKTSQFAIGRSDETVSFNDSSAYGHISHSGDLVECHTIDTLVKRLGLEQVDFIKVDVEGNEAAVLDGAVNTLSNYDPLLHIEFNSWTLVLFSNTHPRLFLERLFDEFKYCLVVNKNSDLLTNIRERSALRGVLIENFFRRGFVTDIMLTNSDERLRELT